MTRSELQDYGAENPIWGFVQRLATERWTGEAAVGIDPRIELFLDEGHVYVAQKAADAPLGARLLAVGALTAEQLRAGGVQLGDTVSLARLFQRDPSVDRDTVELTVDRFTEQLLEQVAEHPVGDVALHPLRHHPSGVHQWRERRAAPMETDDEAMSALVQAVVSLSGEVPVVRADLVNNAPSGTATPTPRLAEPTEAPMSFDPIVAPHQDTAPALPTLASLHGLTPLPTLGATPATAPAPAPPPPPAPAPAPAAPPAAVIPAPPVVPTSTVTPAPIGATMAAPAPGTNAAGAPPDGEAEEIWDMVDELLGLPHTAPATPTAAPDRKSRGWLRGRKG
ncbi:MAG: hypothetical protein ACOYMR_05510 [Ilumatobacteraceae bacterium]